MAGVFFRNASSQQDKKLLSHSSVSWREREWHRLIWHRMGSFDKIRDLPAIPAHHFPTSVIETSSRTSRAPGWSVFGAYLADQHQPFTAFAGRGRSWWGDANGEMGIASALGGFVSPLFASGKVARQHTAASLSWNFNASRLIFRVDMIRQHMPCNLTEQWNHAVTMTRARLITLLCG